MDLSGLTTIVKYAIQSEEPADIAFFVTGLRGMEGRMILQKADIGQ